jgi:hypothetical protein
VVNHIHAPYATLSFVAAVVNHVNYQIVEAVTAIDRQMMQRVWQELDYRIDICRVTKGGHIEHL